MARRFAVLILLACAIYVFGQTPTPTVERAWKLAADGERAQAIDLLRKSMSEEARNADAHLLLGSLLSEDGKRDEAIAQLTDAVSLRPKSIEALNALGEAYNQFNDPNSARKPLERAVAMNPRFGVAQENLGAVLLQLGEPSEAAKHLDIAIPLLDRPSEEAEAHYLRARIYSTGSDFAKAAEHLQKAIALRPDFPEAWSELGVAREANQDGPGALLAFRRAVELNPNGGVAQYRLGAEYLRQAEPQMAIAPLEAAYNLNPEDQSTLNSLQAALRQVGRTQEAAAVKEKLAAVLRNRDQKSQDAIKALRLNNEGAALEKAGSLSEALSKYREAIALNPDHSGIRTNYAVALLRLGRWTEGLTELRGALDRDPNNAQLKTALQDALSKAPVALLPDWAKSSSQ